MTDHKQYSASVTSHFRWNDLIWPEWSLVGGRMKVVVHEGGGCGGQECMLPTNKSDPGGGCVKMNPFLPGICKSFTMR